MSVSPITPTAPSAPLVVGVGGFLGAGKTTTIVAAAQRMVAQGRRVGIVTNDQASGLVDTALARAATETVAEIAGGCFCCRYDVFEETLAELVDQAQPDVILAEAVGSCTDLAATVYQPLRQRGAIPVRLGPLSVVIDARRLHDAQRKHPEGAAGGEDDVAYLYRKQLAEADVLLLNKVDLLSAEERRRVEAVLAETHPGVPVLPLSAAAGEGIAAWLERLVETPGAGARVLELDYDRYAAAEAALGWLNMEGTLTTDGTPVAEWVRAVLDGVRRMAVANAAEIAHVKLWVEPPEAGSAAWGDDPDAAGTAGGNVVGNAREPVVWARGEPGPEARVLVNARVATAPDALRGWIEAAIDEATTAHGATFSVTRLSAFSPARPVPLFRLHPV
ncbi:MAG: Metal chaperone, involved in Zn homeostasis [uncultured Chloroflexi bacterium]|uniref:Metal chaperone, involved in Zn homeostasis n=1 Tax=uncultured Chloroflexota bacterium TaxID=166587 RepID=A0A6J4HEN3_9CHLR|nr:MAG: Metal chaperone, involved in Zn homeostasis [uncultured Chloroflexota bacterium]